MPKIDVHTHILPRNIPPWKEKFGYGGFIALEHDGAACGGRARMLRDDGTFFREVGETAWNAAERLAECDADGVAVQVLSTVPVMFSYWAKPADALEVSRFLNGEIAAITDKFPKRFVGLGTVPLQDTRLAITELERCKAMNLAGVQIGTNVNQQNLGEPRFFDFFKACDELKMSVFVHPWDMMGERDMQKYWLPWLVGMPAETSRAICSLIFSGTLERCRALRICFAHGGGSFPATIGRIEHGFEARPDLVAADNAANPRGYVGKIYFDSLVHEPAMLDYLIKLAGADRVLLGSDYPFPLGESPPGKLIESMPFDDEVKAKLLYRNALAWLGLDESTFV